MVSELDLRTCTSWRGPAFVPSSMIVPKGGGVGADGAAPAPVTALVWISGEGMMIVKACKSS